MPKKLDLTSQKFGKLTALKPSGRKRPSDRANYWWFRCECGEVVERVATHVKGIVRKGYVPTCGKRACTNKIDPPVHDPMRLEIAGQKFGKLTALEPTGQITQRRYAVWRFRCDCGAIVERPGGEVVGRMRGGQPPNCGSPECNNHLKLKYGRAARNEVVRTYHYNAKRRGIEFDLPEEEIDKLLSGNCHYCGVPPSKVQQPRNRQYGEFVYNGIDRLDNSKGYEIGNCVSCCATCNRNKADMTSEDFIAWACRVADYQRNT